MFRLIISRIGQGIVTLFVLVTLTFFLVRAMPGSPYTEEKAIPAHVLKRMKEYTGLDKPLPVQYVTYLKNVIVHQDLGDVIKIVEDESIDLTAQIPHTEGHTYLREILLVADHNAYHLGQIAQIRKELGDWPE